MASGDTLVVLMPGHWESSATSPAQVGWRNYHRYLSYDASSDENAIWSYVMPNSYSGATGVTVKIIFAATASTNAVVWNASFERIGTTQDIDADSFAAANAATTTVAGTIGVPAVSSITFTDGADMDSVAAGELFRIKITRDANNASDTCTGSALLLAVVIEET